MTPKKTLLKTLFSMELRGSDQNNDSFDIHDVPLNESDVPSTNDNQSSVESLEFSELHPNQKFTCLKKRKGWVIPMTYYEGTALCGLEHLNLGQDHREYKKQMHHTGVKDQKERRRRKQTRKLTCESDFTSPFIFIAKKIKLMV